MRRHPRPWSEELRAYIEERVRTLEFVESLDEMEARAEARRVPDSTPLIREVRRR